MVLFFLMVFQFFYFFNKNENTLIEISDKINELTTKNPKDLSLGECHCNRTLYEFNIIEDDFINTTCSWSAYQRGSGQKVLAYVFYGSLKTLRKYFEGIEKNLQLINKFYPGWIFRLYFNSQDSDAKDKLCKIACNYDRIDLCDISNLPGTPKINASTIGSMKWRFFPTLDPQVDYLGSRDLDSIFTQRETEAVKEWFEIGGSFHVMRDHPLHRDFMLGGMWSTNLTWGNVRNQWKDVWNNYLSTEKNDSSRSEYGADQEFLTNHVWPWAQKDVIQHDSYHCNNNTRPFPTKRLNESYNFVGANNGVAYVNKICPESCRPKDHKDWIFC